MRKLSLLLAFVFCGIIAFSQTTDNKCNSISSSLVIIKGSTVLGYGFFVDKNIVVTNYQVINKTNKAQIALFGSETTYNIEGYLDVDKDNDLVLLKVSYNEGKPLKLNSTPVKQGDVSYVVDYKDSKIGCLESKINEVKDFGSIKLIQMNSSEGVITNGFPVINNALEVVGVIVASPVTDSKQNFAVPTEKLELLIKNNNKDLKKLDLLVPPADIIKSKNPNDVERQKILNDLLNQGNAKIYQKDYTSAIAKFDQAIKLFPANADAYIFRGQAKYHLMQFKDAITDFDKAIDLQSEYAEAYDIRGICKAELGDKDGACQDWMRAYELGFNHAFKLLENFCDLDKMMKEKK
jgi:tetratricopeptide (TPR) repeat protein